LNIKASEGDPNVIDKGGSLNTSPAHPAFLIFNNLF